MGLALSFCMATLAHADIVTPVLAGNPLVSPFTSTASSSVTTPQTETGDGSNDGVGPVLVSDVSSNAYSAGSYTFSHTVAANTSSFGSINNQAYNFVDSYVINIPYAQLDAYAFSLNLTSTVSMSNLSARLYSYPANAFTVGGTGSVNGSVYGTWSQSVNGGTVDSTLLPASTPAAGEYVLQIIGLENGTTSGTYNGTLDVTPVPLPASFPLFLVGLVGLGVMRLRAKA